VWSALKFHIDEPVSLRFTYESDGKTVTATAINDYDCDEVTVPLTLTIRVEDGVTKSMMIEGDRRAD
jgi:hypothetical protein